MFNVYLVKRNLNRTSSVGEKLRTCNWCGKDLVDRTGDGIRQCFSLVEC